ncbi:MAG: 4-alpha-glucanotransferase [Acidiferrobacteraceae bacterium]
MNASFSTLDRRRAGILLHPTSLPGGYGNGDLGADAFRFIDFLSESGATVWQILPHGPTHDDGSPYQALSVHAGNPLWINLEELVSWRWLNSFELPSGVNPSAWRRRMLREAYQGFEYGANDEDCESFHEFCRSQAYWLDDFALYAVLREEQEHRAWQEWPVQLRDRDPDALREAHTRLIGGINQTKFEQFVFFRQWYALRAYASQKGILLFGDLPIYVALDSADVWARRDQFDLDEQGQPRTVAGVPPDYFSATGQRWGNPHYAWKTMQDQNFSWWHERTRSLLAMYDLVRIDHFRGFEAFWSIPADKESAVDGEWIKAPGEELFSSLVGEFGELPLVAEDLGVITEAVTSLRRRFGFPGMRILQFAFGSGADNPYLPHNHEPDSVVYTGTHDNNTTCAWYEELADDERGKVDEYLGHSSDAMPWPLVRASLASVALLSVTPLQDVLELGAGYRMNTPSTTRGNWRWRFEWEQLTDDRRARLARMVEVYGRTPVKATA